MATLFEPAKLGPVQVKNRFVRSATYDGMARETGEVTDELVRRYRNLARGEVGLAIVGSLYVHPLGQAFKYQAGIHNDDMILGLRRLVEAVHAESGKVAFQLVHAGGQTTKGMIGQTPLAPSDKARDPISFSKPAQMTEEQIHEVIRAFGQAAHRAVQAGADGVQIHAAHGYLVNEFLSPFFNDREDGWGGSSEKRFRFLREIVMEIKKALPEGTALLVKLNTHDHTPREGITPPLALEYAAWLAGLEIDGLEVSCGTVLYSYMNMCRGEVPVDELMQSLRWWQKPFGRLTLKRLVGNYDLQEGYNVEAGKMIKPVVGEVSLFAVGGFRRLAHMERVLEQGHSDFISMSRPFIREPFLVKRIKEGKADAAACASCNRCLAAVVNDMPVRCYRNGFPQ